MKEDISSWVSVRTYRLFLHLYRMIKLITLGCFLSLPVFAQEGKEVMKPVTLLFAGMKQGDSAMVRRAFHQDAVLHTVLTDPKTHEPRLQNEGLAGFLKSVGTPHKEVYNEMIWGERIEIDADMAQVWVGYAFYLGTTFNHCGVDAFHLIRNTKGEWLIYSLSDTRRKTGCNVPKEVSERVK